MPEPERIAVECTAARLCARADDATRSSAKFGVVVLRRHLHLADRDCGYRTLSQLAVAIGDYRGRDRQAG
jgi:hypothetical protein